MKKTFKMYITAALVCVFLCIAAFSVSAAEYPDKLRVGIYYGSGVVQNINFECSNGFLVGISGDRNFYSYDAVESTAVTAAKSSPGTYHILYSTHTTLEDAAAQLGAFRQQGLDVFPGYYGSAHCVFSGTYSSYQDAQTAIESLGISGTPVAMSANALCLTDTKTGKTLFVSDISGANVAVYSKDTDNPDSLITISGVSKGTYRGGFECKALSSDGLTVVNIVPVEHYLYSVVSNEMSPSWHTEALKAQAVCARNFALRRINYHSSYGFDVCRTVCCQAYSTTADQSESVHTAVDGTRGQLLFCGNELVQAVYSSSMGSSTEDVKNVWGSSFSYLVSVDNPYEDTENIYNGKWTKTLTKARATEIMKNSGNDVGNVTDITVLEYTDAGRVLKLRVQGTSGEAVFERERCRTIFGEVAYSQKYTVTPGGVITYPTVRIATGNNTVTKTVSSASVLTGNNTQTTLSGSFFAYDGTSAKEYSVQQTGGDPDTFVFSGEGWGHGVGMSQYGAKGMAEAGFNYEEILTHYYTGTHLTQAY